MQDLCFVQGLVAIANTFVRRVANLMHQGHLVAALNYITYMILGSYS